MSSDSARFSRMKRAAKRLIPRWMSGRKAVEEPTPVVSWPQEVVKVMEYGTQVNRQLEIQNADERVVDFQQPQANWSVPTTPWDTILSNGGTTRHVNFVPPPKISRVIPMETIKEQPAPVQDASVTNLPAPPHPPIHAPPANEQPTAAAKPSEPPIFVFPSAVAAKKHAWRYSVDAAEACDRERRNERYSFHGDDFHYLIPQPEITDPAVLERIEKIRERERAQQPAPTPRYGPAPRPVPLPPPHHEMVDTPQPITEPELTIPPEITNSTLQPPATATSNCPSINSSNIRTPTWMYGPLTHHLPPRKKVHVIPRETKAEQSQRGRAPILKRWTSDRLSEMREKSKKAEVYRNGAVWKPAEYILGRAKSRRRRWRRKKSESIPPGPVCLPTVPEVPENRPVQSSAAESSLSDLISSTVRQPRKRQSRKFPPRPAFMHLWLRPRPAPPSISATPNSTTPLPPATYKIVNDNATRGGRAMLGMRIISPGIDGRFKNDILDLSGLSSAEAQVTLLAFLRRPMDPIQSTARANRLHISNQYFEMPQMENHIATSLEDLVEYFDETYREIRPAESITPLESLHHANLIRLLITQELFPYPCVRKELYDDVQRAKRGWPIMADLGLRPIALIRFMHHEANILMFISTEDEMLYLWSQDWDENIFGGNRRLIRGGRTITECEQGIIDGLHVLEFEDGGWLKFDESIPPPNKLPAPIPRSFIDVGTSYGPVIYQI